MKRTNFTEPLCDTKMSLMQLLSQEVTKVNKQVNPSYRSVSRAKETKWMKLPAIKVPKFNGD